MAGRPKTELTDLPEGWAALIYEVANNGGSQLECRSALGISNDLWYRLKSEEPEFSEAVKRAEEACQVWWEQLGRNMSMGAIDKGNATTWIFNMKNRFGWKDKLDIDQKTDLTAKVEMTPSRALEVLAAAGIDPDTLDG